MSGLNRQGGTDRISQGMTMNEDDLPKDEEPTEQASVPASHPALEVPAKEPEELVVDQEPGAAEDPLEKVPLSVDEAKELGREVKDKAKAKGLELARSGKQAAAGPARVAGRTWMRSIRRAANNFFDSLGADPK